MVGVEQEGGGVVQLAVGYGGQSMAAVVGINVGDGTDQRVDIYFLNDAGIVAAADNQIDLTAPPTNYGIIAQAYEFCVQTTPTVVDSEAATGDSDPLTNIQIAAIIDEMVFGLGGSGNTSTGVTWAGTNPLIALTNLDVNATAHAAAADRLVTGTETVNHNLTFTTAPNRVAGCACKVGFDPGVTREQDSFRYYNDDGTEATATARENQNVDLVIARTIPFHARVGTQYVSDPVAEAAEWRYKETADAVGEYRKIP